MGRTSIPCSDETRDRLAALKAADETWDDCLSRLAGETAPATDDRRETILAELRQIRDAVEAEGGDDLTVNAIREAVRIEVRNQFEEFRQ